MLFGSLAAAAATDAEDALASITALVTHDVAAAVAAARAATSSFESAYPSADAARRLSSSFGGYIGEEHWTSKENCDGDPYRIDYTRPFFDASGDCDGPYAVDGQTFSAAGTCTSESEFEGKTYLGAGCEGYVVDQWSGDYTGMCAPNVDGDFSYSYSFSYNDVDGMFRRSCAAPDPADYLELTMYPFDGGDCGDEFSYPMKQLWNTALCQDQGGTAVQYRCDDDDGFHIAIFVGSSCDGEPFMTYGEGLFPYSGPTGECLSSGGMGFKVSCTPWFGLLDGAASAAPAALALALASLVATQL